MNTPTRPSTVPDRCAGLDLNALLPAADLPLARLAACGLSNQNSATRLHRSENTIKSHLMRLLRSTGASTRLQLVVWMYETGRVVPEIPLLPRHPHNERVTAEHFATLSLHTLHHQLTTTRAELDRLLILFEPWDRA
ncbi:helix-turn-helix transcriptional regulator [Saccharopolyspora gloriosae]|uniref:helix-turn-helix domain-containing protein n=1 Tax=Saccharopolyspora gloriosae TaxID=455344 RepID=UPI001FB59908|nr:helix-turn-helix transcriptional regulator [Saccharopolyspora gloriosae]